jgi:hypothetical protein
MYTKIAQSTVHISKLCLHEKRNICSQNNLHFPIVAQLGKHLNYIFRDSDAKLKIISATGASFSQQSGQICSELQKETRPMRHTYPD